MSIIKMYDEWVADGGHGSPRAINRVASLMKADAKGRPSKRGKFRASMTGDPCQRKRQLSYMQAPETPTDKMFAVFGTWGHYRWQMAGLTTGFLREVEVPVSGKNFSGTADGTLYDGRLFELKTTNASMLSKLESGATEVPVTHLLQVQALMHYGPWTEAALVYEDRAFGGKTEIAIAYDDLIGEEIETGIADLVRMRYASKIPSMHPECTPDSKMRYYCSFKDSCLHRWMDDEG